MFQGMARGKVGDVVFYRLNGQQISRVRNRKPANPRTNAQLYQRAIMATTMLAYSAGKEIFDHSFQGKRVGEDNMRTFLSRNARALRGQLAYDIDNNVELSEATSRLVGPKSISPVAVPGLIISQGELVNDVLTYGVSAANQPVNIAFGGTRTASTSVADWMTQTGIKPGDIFTICAFVTQTDQIRYEIDGIESPYAKQYNTLFGWLRLIVKQDVPNGNLGDKTIGSLFNVSADGTVFHVDAASLSMTKENYTMADLLGSLEVSGTIGIIRSRDDMDLRSTAEMIQINPSKAYGLAGWYVLQAWLQGSGALGNSDLILEGGQAGSNAAGNTNNGGQGGSSDEGDSRPPGGSGS